MLIRAYGYAVFELLIVCILFVLTLYLSVPSYRQWCAENQLKASAEQFAAALSFASGRAQYSGQRVHLCQSHNLKTCTNDAAAQYLVRLDSSIVADQQVIQVYPQLAQSVKIFWRAFKNYKENQPITFDPQQSRFENGTAVFCIAQMVPSQSYAVVQNVFGKIHMTSFSINQAKLRGNEENFQKLYQACVSE